MRISRSPYIKAAGIRSYMKRIETIFLRACGYCVLILSLFYAFGAINEYSKPYIDFKTFLVILLFGVIVSVGGFILTLEKLKMPLRILIHYITLFVAFYAIFIVSGNLGAGGSSAIFSAVIIFTFLYIVIFTMVYFIRKGVKKADSIANKKLPKKNESEKTKPKYKSLYKTED